jgi:hypothetical protein
MGTLGITIAALPMLCVIYLRLLYPAILPFPQAHENLDMPSISLHGGHQYILFKGHLEMVSITLFKVQSLRKLSSSPSLFVLLGS